jgi:hypothetical protein
VWRYFLLLLLLLLLLQWHYSPMQTFSSLMDISQSALTANQTIQNRMTNWKRSARSDRSLIYVLS